MVVGFWCLWSVVFYFFNTFGSHFSGVWFLPFVSTHVPHSFLIYIICQ
jgi:hypothetical protein